MSKSYHDTQENKERIFVCEECNKTFSDEEIRKDVLEKKWGHICKAKKFRKECRCESYLTAYLPEE